jgi:hypothetical protein
LGPSIYPFMGEAGYIPGLDDSPDMCFLVRSSHR